MDSFFAFVNCPCNFFCFVPTPQISVILFQNHVTFPKVASLLPHRIFTLSISLLFKCEKSSHTEPRHYGMASWGLRTESSSWRILFSSLSLVFSYKTSSHKGLILQFFIFLSIIQKGFVPCFRIKTYLLSFFFWVILSVGAHCAFQGLIHKKQNIVLWTITGGYIHMTF